MEPEETITIPFEEYKRLKKDSITLRYLQDGGVDNWEWYSDCFGSNYNDELEQEGLDD